MKIIKLSKIHNQLVSFHERAGLFHFSIVLPSQRPLVQLNFKDFSQPFNLN